MSRMNMGGPHGRGPHGGKRLYAGGPTGIKKDTIKRLLSYLKQYKIRMIFVFICIIISTVASVASSLFMQTLIDSYITPLLLEAAPVFTGLARAIAMMGCLYAAGALASLFYSRTMAVVSQGVLKDIRNEMFEHMQTLPIKYFDTRTHGDIMSYYTNDTDTLRQMLSQSLPNLFASLLSMIAVFASMLHLSIWLTLVTMAFTCIILLVMKKIAGMSGKYFVAQQKSLGDVNGYIEEMINGLKVVKVFCHEEKAQEVFDGKNEELCENMTKANILANIVMPLMGSLGYVLYVIIAIVGGFMGIAGVTNLSVGGEPVVTLGTIASFLILSRNFINPIAQVSQQMNAVIMAMAGASRIFELLDEPAEEDHGTVTLVNASRDRDGNLTECSRHTGI